MNELTILIEEALEQNLMPENHPEQLRIYLENIKYHKVMLESGWPEIISASLSWDSRADRLTLRSYPKEFYAYEIYRRDNPKRETTTKDIPLPVLCEISKMCNSTGEYISNIYLCELKKDPDPVIIVKANKRWYQGPQWGDE